MSAFPSNYVVNKINDQIFKGTAISLGTSRYLALYTTNPTAANTGTEASGGSYARQSFGVAASSGGTSTSSALVTFTSMSAGTYPYYGILDAITGGNLIVFGALIAPITANTGDNVVINSAAANFTLSGS